MKIKVKDTLYIEYDNMNFSPFYWNDSALIVSGKHVGKMSEAKWSHSGKYFGTLLAALKWCTNEELIKGEDVDLEGYLAEYERISEEFAASIEKSLKEFQGK